LAEKLFNFSFISSARTA